MTVAALYLKENIESQHVGSVPQKREVGMGGGGVTYVVSFPQVLKTDK